MNKDFFKNVEFLRFVFILLIMFYHIIFVGAGNVLSTKPFSTIHPNALHMKYCTEFFFIISGFFLALTYKPTTTVLDFVKKRVIRLVPVILFTTILFAICSLFKMVKFWGMDDVFAVFLLNGIQIAKHHSSHGIGSVYSSWFVSVLFLVSLFYFYIRKSFGEKIFNLTAAVFTVLGLFWASYKVHTVIPGPIVRGLTIGLGIIMGQIYACYRKPIRNFCANKVQTIIITLLELGVFGYLMFGLCFKTKDRLEPTDLIFLFTVLFILFILKKGLFSKLLNNNFSTWLGKYVYSIFITHTFVLGIFKKYYFTPGFYSGFQAGGGDLPVFADSYDNMYNFRHCNILYGRTAGEQIFKEEMEQRSIII